MWGYPYYSSAWVFDWFHPVISLIIFIFVVFLFVRIFRGSRHHEIIEKIKNSKILENETPLDIIQKRYAKGEIDKNKYEEMKKDLSK